MLLLVGFVGQLRSSNSYITHLTFIQDETLGTYRETENRIGIYQQADWCSYLAAIEVPHILVPFLKSVGVDFSSNFEKVALCLRHLQNDLHRLECS